MMMSTMNTQNNNSANLQKQKANQMNTQSSGKPVASEDGITHINIGGITPLGSKLSHFAYTPFDHPQFGKFQCLEGLWHWLKDPQHRDIFRTMSGQKAKSAGKLHSRRKIDQFMDVILAANYYKLTQHPDLLELMKNSTLPFKHYYMSGELDLVTEVPSSIWMCHLMEDVRQVVKGEKELPNIDYRAVL